MSEVSSPCTHFADTLIWNCDYANECGWKCIACDAFILREMAEGRHAEFWRGVSNGILAGKDPRNRCACGALSTVTSVGGPGRENTYRCTACWSKEGAC